MNRHRILVVDDTPSIHEDFRKILCPAVSDRQAVHDLARAIFGTTATTPPRANFEVSSAMQGEEGLALVQDALAQGRPFAVAFVDMRMPPGWDGLETISRIWQADPDLQVVICTAFSDHSWSTITERLGQSDNLLILKKPFDDVVALQLAHALGRKWELARDNRSRLTGLDDLVRERTRELSDAEERFSRAFDASPHAQLILGLDPFEIMAANTAFERLTGLPYADIRHLTPETFGRGVNAETLRSLLGQLAAGRSVDEHPFTLTAGDGHPRELRCSARPVVILGRPCSIWLLRDVTTEQQLEKQLRHAQKMEAVGQLAAGIAHDFNNLLTVILSYIGFAAEDPGLAPDNRQGLREARGAAERAAALTRQLLIFSRRQIARPERIDVAESVASLRGMLSRLIPARIQLLVDLPASLSAVTADPSNLEQVVMNLVINARDAIPRDGQIMIRLRDAVIAPGEPPGHIDRRPGRFVLLEVADTGGGIPPEALAKIFEPFFTTKPAGQGTGLGLSTVYAIVHQLGGWIEVASRLGEGSSFQVYLPADPEPAAPPTVASRPARTGPAENHTGQRILLVEDDPAVRLASSEIARQAGFQVTEAVDGPSALRIWESARGSFDLVLTDIVMPNGMTGLDLVRTLQRERSDLKVIVTTGYSKDLLDEAQLRSATTPLLLKPYSRKSLLDTIGRVLASP